MSANDYYNTYDSYNSHGYGGAYRRENAPLPPLPTNTSSPRPTKPAMHNVPAVGPTASPFDDDQAYPSYPQPSTRPDQPWSRDAYQKPYSDPFGDPSAISLDSQSKPGFHATNTPTDGRDYENQWGRRDSPDPQRKGQGAVVPQGPWYTRKQAWFVYIITTIQIVVFIAELIRNGVLTGSPIEIHPQFNPMIGPSPYVLINMGARYVPCMRNVHLITDSTSEVLFQCPNTTTLEAHCQLSELCGFNGVPNPDPADADLNRKPEPNQWFRFIIPIFLHAGIIHIGFNMLLQVLLGREMELIIGTIRFALVYFSAGIFGFVFGGNFAATGIASTGASGSLFGILALVLLDLLYNWNNRRSPVKELLFIIADVLVAFVLGLLPGLDNFSHIGGFVMGLALGICILRSPAPLRARLDDDRYPGTPYSAVPGDRDYSSARLNNFVHQPVGFFKGRKPLWWGWWLIRAAALVGVLVGFILLLRNFYVYRTTCGWCKYLSCLPINHWCDLGNLRFQNQTTNSNNPRSIFGPAPGLAKLS